MLNEVTDGNDYDINDTQGDIIEELIHVETDEIVLNKSASQLEKPNQMLENNQNKVVNQKKFRLNLVLIVQEKLDAHIVRIIYKHK